MKADLHVHSKFSKRPSQWILQKINCPESFTEPRRLYDIAMKRGMSLVTITDHNTIEGAMEIAHLPNAFISEEVTTYFPDDKCKIHVLAFNINETQHRQVQKARKNIFDLVAYLQDEQVVHALAHPLYSTNDRLTEDHFEQLLLLFKTLELNGARDGWHNDVVEWVVRHLGPTDIQRLSERYGISPGFAEPWRKNLIGGSDDHSSLCIAHKYTRVENASSIASFLEGIQAQGAEPCGRESTPRTLSHNLYSIAYQYYKEKFKLHRHTHRDMFLCFLDRFLQGNDQETGVLSKLYFHWHHHTRPKKGKGRLALQDLVRDEAHKLIWNNPQLRDIVNRGNGKQGDLDGKWFDFVNHVSNRVLLHFGDRLLDHLSGANFIDLFSSAGSAGALYAILAPYFLAFSLFTKDRQLTQRIAGRFNYPQMPVPHASTDPNVAHFTDTFSGINGVALSLQQQVRLASETGKHLTIITCEDTHAEDRPGVKYFSPIGYHELPEYPEQKLFYPPFLEMLDFCFEQRFTHIHSATPGPIGLAALAISRILKLPINGTYHTSLPQYAAYLTDDSAMEDLMWKYVLWYYAQLDFVYVPSRSTGDELIEKGIPAQKIRQFPRGINIRRFHPSKRDPQFFQKHADSSCFKLLYVGRVSREKNLPILVEAYKSLLQTMDNVVLIVAGEGPYLRSMKQELNGTPCWFTGYLKGEALSTLYASADLFVFPSTTDTFGNVVLEAQASGIPVVVTDAGGPCENMVDGETGLMVPADDVQAMLECIRTLAQDPLRAKAMGRAARKYMENRSFESAFDQTWRMYDPYEVMHMPSTRTFAEAI
jgi:glycosyltransferase involved in cell wall biosynthesis